MPDDNHETLESDGAFDWSGGVDSDAVTTVRSELVPHGLRRDQLAWLSNGSVRGGAISPRDGWQPLVKIADSSGVWQGHFLYEPIAGGDPFIVCVISGRVYSVPLDPPYTVTDLTAKYGVAPFPITEQCFFCEAEGFLIIQAGDYESAIAAGTTPTLPLFYHSPYSSHNEILRASRGIFTPSNPPNAPPWQELPAGMAMVYYMNRVWIAQGRTVVAGDISGDRTSGTAFYNYRDAVLEVTENPVVTGGDGFSVPTQAGNIRALAYTANLDVSLGQGPLYIFTRKQVYQLVVPVTRTDWTAATTNNAPQMTAAQINNGATGSKSVLHVNGDLFYQSFDPAIRSLMVATRWYGQWGNVPLSRNVDRALQFNNRALMRLAPSVQFDNRALQGVLPMQLPQGVVCQGMLPLNFDTISTLGEREAPAWEGMWSGLNFLDACSDDFNGLQRSFAIVVSAVDSSINVWELTPGHQFENGDNRITFYAEFPAFTWGREFRLKKLHGGEIWVDRLFGECIIKVEYRPDADACWHLWTQTTRCVARNCEEDVNQPVCYPLPGQVYGQGQAWPIGLPAPPADCRSTKRPSDLGYQFQVRVTVTGYLRIRGILLYAEMRDKGLYDDLQC
jgi:hypothetical protein